MHTAETEEGSYGETRGRDLGEDSSRRSIGAGHGRVRELLKSLPCLGRAA